jgi:hypothetical protein
MFRLRWSYGSWLLLRRDQVLGNRQIRHASVDDRHVRVQVVNGGLAVEGLVAGRTRLQRGTLPAAGLEPGRRFSVAAGDRLQIGTIWVDIHEV